MKEAATNESKEQGYAFVQSKIIVGAEVRAADLKSGRAVGNVVIKYVPKAENRQFIYILRINYSI